MAGRGGGETEMDAGGIRPRPHVQGGGSNGGGPLNGPEADEIGTVMGGRFRLEQRVGSGGMSCVYRAYDPTLERMVAIKLMHRDISHDPDQLERFRREARLVAQLSHPHVVAVIDVGEHEGVPFIVLEYVEGETLRQRIRRFGQLPVHEAVGHAIEIGRALECAHAHGLVHRDVKPQNVLIDANHRVKVTDFGIAAPLEDRSAADADRVLGTPAYLSPEQALGRQATAQSDVYSLGILLYEMLTGTVPFKALTHHETAMKHVTERLQDVRQRRPEVSAALAAAVERATAKEPRNRPATAAEAVQMLREVMTVEIARGRRDSARRAEAPPTRTRWKHRWRSVRGTR
jgi:serine/threonine protein kinase